MKYLRKIIEYGLYLLVFLLPLQTRWIIKAGSVEYLTYSLYGTDILLIGLLLMFFIREIASPACAARLPAVARNDRMTWFLIFGLLLASGVSALFALDKPLALYRFGWLVSGAGLFWLVIKADYSRTKLVWSLLVGLALQAGLAVGQFFLQATFANKWLGLAWHRAGDLGASVIETMGADGVGERWLRAYGGLDHPNMLGGILAIGILLLVGEIIRYNKFSIFPEATFGTSNFQTISWILLTLYSAALFFSFSRSAWLALGVGLAALMIMAMKQKDLRAQKNILQAVLISGAIGFILFWQYPNLALTRLYQGGRLEVKSTSERVESLKNFLPIIKSNWLSGVSLGNYVLALRRELPTQEKYFYQPAHNAFLLVWVETGIFGAIFFLGMMLYLIILNFKFKILNYGDEKIKNFGFINTAALVVLIVLLSFDHWLWSLHFGVMFFWLMLGLAAKKEEFLDFGSSLPAQAGPE